MDEKATGFAHLTGGFNRAFGLLVLVACLPGAAAFAQETGGSAADEVESAESADGSEPASNETDAPEDLASPPVRRLGDVAGEEYEFDLSLPVSTQQPAASEQRATLYELPDHSQNARLQSVLSRLAARPGNPQALKELQAVLQEALVLADDLMNEGDLDEASQVLSVIGNVDRNTKGLDEAKARLNTLLPDNPAKQAPKKQNTVDSVSPYNLPDAEQTRRLDELLAVLASRPGYAPAQRELDALLDNVLQQAERARQEGDYERAEQLNRVVRAVNPRKKGLRESQVGVETARQIDEWLAAAGAAERSGALFDPRLNSAYFFYRKVVEADPTNTKAQKGLQDIQQVMIGNALDAARNLDFELADDWLEEATAVREQQDLVVDARAEIAGFRDNRAQAIEAEIVQAIRDGDFNQAEFHLIDLIALGGYEHRVTTLRDMIAREQVYGSYEPGQVIRDSLQDGGHGPAVIVVGAGGFQMGASSEDRDREDHETPLHRVNIRRAFAMGINEVTVNEFRAFAQATGYKTDAEVRGSSNVWDEEMGRLAERPKVSWQLDYQGDPAAGELPVLHVSWNDAQAYVRWLSETTGEAYRLPTEAEYEYAMRAGSRQVYWWGEDRPRDPFENFSGEHDQSPSGRYFSNFFKGYDDGHWGPAPVRSFSANVWGLYDMAGNVSEWVQDCWHANYVRAPFDGSAWENPGCKRRVVRGGYWASSPGQARSSARISAPAGLHTPQVGFRVVREL